MKGHKDKSGKFHPHNNSNNNVSSKDIMARNNISESKAKEGLCPDCKGKGKINTANPDGSVSRGLKCLRCGRDKRKKKGKL